MASATGATHERGAAVMNDDSLRVLRGFVLGTLLGLGLWVLIGLGVAKACNRI